MESNDAFALYSQLWKALRSSQIVSNLWRFSLTIVGRNLDAVYTHFPYLHVWCWLSNLPANTVGKYSWQADFLLSGKTLGGTHSDVASTNISLFPDDSRYSHCHTGPSVDAAVYKRLQGPRRNAER